MCLEGNRARAVGEALSEREEPNAETKPIPARGLVSSPRGYFGRASRAAARSTRAAPSEPAAAPGAAGPQAPVYRAGDPALRLFATLTLPFPPTAPLTGAIATLSGIADGEHEKLLIELGTSLVRATPRRDEASGTLSLILSRTHSAEVYRSLLATLRYVNDAAEPSPGLRKAALQTVDAAGTVADVAATTIGVGEIEPAAPDVAPSAGAETTETNETAGDVSAKSTAPAGEPPALDKRVIFGESMRFNSDGDFTLFWWPRLLATGRSRRAKTGEPAPEPAALPGSYFSQGGRHYRVFDPEPEAPAPAQPRAANDAAKRARAAAEATDDDAARPANDVWMPGRGLPPPGFARAPMLRLEDVFGSDMENALVRRLVEQRIAAGA